MAFAVGKHVVAESESTDRRPRPGVIEEVLRGDPSPRYHIRWDDDHESIHTRAGGIASTLAAWSGVHREYRPEAKAGQLPRAGCVSLPL